MIERLEQRRAPDLSGAEASGGDDPVVGVVHQVVESRAERQVLCADRGAAAVHPDPLPAAADIRDFHQQAFAERALDICVPLLAVRSHPVAERRGHAAADAGGGRLDQSGDERVGDRCARRRRVRRGGLLSEVDGGLRQEAAPEIARAGPDATAARREEDSVAGAEHERRRKLPRQSDARREIVLVRVRLLARVAVAPGKSHQSFLFRERIGEVRVEICELVVAVRPRALVFPADSEVQGDVAPQLPVILHVPRVVLLRGGKGRVQRKLPAGGSPEQQRRDTESAAAARD